MANAHASPHLDLFLNVSANSISCARALHTLRNVLDDFPAAAIRLRVLDVGEDIAAAERHRDTNAPKFAFLQQSRAR